MRSSDPKDFLQCGDKNYEAGRHDWQYGWYHFVGTDFVKEKSVLDVGCGMGNSHFEFFNGGASYVLGIDIDWRIASNKSVCGKHEFKYMLIEEIPDSSFDIVTAIDVIEHIVEDITFLKELIRCAKQDVFLTTPNFWHTKNAWPYHCREYKPEQFTDLCKSYAPNGSKCWFYGCKDLNGYDLIPKHDSLDNYKGPHLPVLGCHIILSK
ncbi:MAG: class I SAM-dependent methyltransferase [Deltaproteobacteria bacterium]|nr:class I SAM-dependent methyltransferase [Deltaproteobacteria bacterium]